jgi:hypothetical protein
MNQNIRKLRDAQELLRRHKHVSSKIMYDAIDAIEAAIGVLSQLDTPTPSTDGTATGTREARYAIAENGNEYWSLEWDRKTRTYTPVRSVFGFSHYASEEIAQAAADNLNAGGGNDGDE